MVSRQDSPVDVDQVGKLLFGRACRLKLALWIACRDKPQFFQSEPPKEVILPSDAAKELGQLVRLGMLVEERPDGDRRVWYIRTDSRLWEIIDAAVEALELD
jgi:hypothetical protein